MYLDRKPNILWFRSIEMITALGKVVDILDITDFSGDGKP
jgi:hypothetical protein